jgi:nicotinate-nucleotide adenylyltransferase
MSSELARLGVMGGTFDPVHVGHLVAASEVQHALELDRVLFVPAGEPWQKDAYTAAEDRFLMVTLATDGHPGFSVSRMELDRRGPTYTADTLETLKEFYGDVELFFIAGADAVQGLPTWIGFERLKPLADVVVVTRPGFEKSSMKTTAEWPLLHFVDTPEIGISSTEIRDRVRSGRPIDFLVPDDVAGYIRDQGLYVGQDERADV